MDSSELSTKLAQAESKIDYYEAELSYLHDLLVRCGFADGIATLKMSAEELLLEEV